MMAENKICAGCLREGENNSAQSWCSNCSEPVCLECARSHRKLSFPHRVVPIENVQGLSSEINDLLQSCNTHLNEKIILFCCQHDKVICETCLSETHQECKSIMSIEKASNGIRDSDTISDLQKRLCNLIKVSEGILRSQVKNQDDVKESNDEIKIEISKMKTTLIDHLNKLEERLNKDLDLKYKESQESILKDRQEIQSILGSATSWKKYIDSLHPYANEIHLFQAVKKLDAKTNELELKIRDIQSAGLVRLELHKPKDVSNMEAFFPSLGTITVEIPTVLETATLDINQQGQAIVSSQVEKKKLSLISCFMVDIFGRNFKISYGCLIPGKRLLLSFVEKKMLATCNLDGSEAKSIELEYEPHSFTLYDKILALVTSWEGCFIQTLNLTSLKPEKKIFIGKNCGGITCSEGKIWLSVDIDCLIMTNLNGDILKKINTKANPCDISMNTGGDVFFTRRETGDFKVLRANSKDVTNFNWLRHANGIAVGDSNCVYASQWKPSNIYRIHEEHDADGEDTENLLNGNDVIENPSTLSYDNETKHLMIINENGKSVLIYKIH